MRGIDALVFTGGIGEHSGTIDARIRVWIEAGYDKQAKDRECFEAEGSKAARRIPPANEEIVREGSAFLQAKDTRPPA